MPRVVLDEVSKRYDKERDVVGKVSLELPDASFTAVLGPSGCGKTTMLRMVAGLEVPNAGRIIVGDRLMSSADTGVFVPPNERRLGFVFQNFALWPHLSVRRNVEFGLVLHKAPRTQRRRRVAEVLDLLHVGHLADRLPAQLSGGEQQRVAIARALAPGPALVLFDEPLSSLDAPLRLELSAELRRLHRELDVTAVLVTHDQAEAMSVATRLVVMREGRIEQSGHPGDVYRAPNCVHVAGFLGNPPMNLLAPTGELARLRDHAADDRRVRREFVATLGVRPEHVRIGAPLGGWTTGARVVSVVSTGPSDVVELALAHGPRITALLPAERTVDPGLALHVSVDPERVHLFDADGRALARDGVPPGTRAADRVERAVS